MRNAFFVLTKKPPKLHWYQYVKLKERYKGLVLSSAIHGSCPNRNREIVAFLENPGGTEDIFKQLIARKQNFLNLTYLKWWNQGLNETQATVRTVLKLTSFYLIVYTCSNIIYLKCTNKKITCGKRYNFKHIIQNTKTVPKAVPNMMAAVYKHTYYACQ